MRRECQEQRSDTEDGKVGSNWGRLEGLKQMAQAKYTWEGQGRISVQSSPSKCPLSSRVGSDANLNLRETLGLQNSCTLSHRKVLASQRHRTVFLKPLTDKSRPLLLLSHNTLNFPSRDLLQSKYKFIYVNSEPCNQWDSERRVKMVPIYT